jgi:hypothetical protein
VVHLICAWEDVYPVRWTSKTGKSGYSPVCKNDRSPVCDKTRIKCSDCSHQAFEAISDDIYARHLNAKINRIIGVYPMLKNETCWFLATVHLYKNKTLRFMYVKIIF